MAKPALDEEEILEIVGATQRAVAREGPWRFTLSHVAKELAVTPEDLVKRFGARRGLLKVVSEHLDGTFARGPREGALDALHRALADHLPLAVAVEFLDGMRSSIEALLDEAVTKKELAPCETAALARTVEIAFHGTAIEWGERKIGKLDDALRTNVDAVLAPFTTKRTDRAGPSPRASRRSSGGGRASRGT